MQTITRRGCTAAPYVQQAATRCRALRPSRDVWQQATPRAYSASHFTTYTLTTDDKLEIMELCHKFDHTLNAGRQDKLGAFFAPDAQVVTPRGTVKGVPAILDYFNTCRPIAAGNRHLTCNIIVEPEGVRAAKATAYRLLHTAACPPRLLASGVIEDRLVSVDGEWRFAQRTFLMDPPAEAQQEQPAPPAN